VSQESLGSAIVGTGKVADAHALGYGAASDCRLISVVDADRMRSRSFAARYGCEAAASLETVLADPRIDIVSICTPHPTHADIAIRAMAAKRHVLVEKPMAVSVDDCDRMIDQADHANVRLGVVSQRRWYEPVQRIRRAIDDGKLGRPILSTLELLGWRSSEYYAMDPWRGTVAGEGGGVLMTQATHHLDLLLWLAGSAVRVAALHGTFNHPDIEVEDTAVALIEFASGGLGSIVVSNSQRPGLWGRLRIHGTTAASAGVETERGSAFISGVSKHVDPALNDVWTVPGEEHLIDEWRAADLAASERIDPMTHYHALQICDFVNAVVTGRPPRVTGHDGRAAVELITAIYEAHRSRSMVELGTPPRSDSWACPPGCG
jgi:UDP-N-acetyl-2-amino-2-deoxyglucuronate dehydrogenase